MTRSILYATAAAVLVPLSAYAQTPDDPDDDLPEVVVTATRLPAIVADMPGARVIDRATIDRRGAVFAADILSDVPGLSVVRSGGFGGVAQVRIRGASPGKTLVLVDGVPVNDPAEVNGAFDLSGFELSDIERIEVLSGPQSSLWGSDAIGGVIAFTTRELDGLSAGLEAGSFDTVRGRLAVGVSTGQYGFGAWVSHFDTDGISAADEADGNPEADGFTSTTVGARGRHAFTPDASVDGTLRWTDSQADLDGFPAPTWALADTLDTQSSEQWSGFGRLRLNALGLAHQFSLSASNIARETVSAFPSAFEGDRRVVRWQAEGAVSGVDFVIGAEREDTEGSLSTGLTERLGTSSAFATARIEPTDRLSLTVALRFDDTDDFGSKATGRASGAFDAGAGFTLSAAYGTGFKAPSISQAVCDFCFSSQPFPVLRPETAEGYEAAVGWASADGRIGARATVYRLNVEDQITYVFDPVTFDSFYVNVARTETDGVELEGRARLGGGFDLSVAYAWTDARDEMTGARLLRVPEQAGSATLGWTGERLSGSLTVRAESDQDDVGGVREPFVTAGLNASYALTETATLTARIENLTDERYQQVFGYGEPGRSGYAGIRLRY
ncbi:TonB-dependent receptor plug domain-containing protein [Brevundimonas sp. UBA2416]|uniref:TonB-dependent receptor plug domain-containing protein n=1 Tax=Brevundimonas sp. UBA2416 TaxID=1946124 RepID=UPI0025C5442A|nr:TonB-dependent receptor [Brevundimonas sp. UBA2416]HRJ64133.1 TonB-dependent receptor [Brevundimonas sp.]